MYHQSHTRRIFLASSSRYRKQQLHQLQLNFEAIPANIDETPYKNERPADLVRRLAEEKAAAISVLHPEAVIIGSDQVAIHEGRVLGKPGTKQKAVRQLMRFSGAPVRFLTAVCVCCKETGYSHNVTVTSEAGFRVLSRSEIERYVEMDDPLDCAGGFKSEAAGASLLKYLRSDDPSAIIGLPLITVAALLRENGYEIP